jgi:hypothetical protein
LGDEIHIFQRGPGDGGTAFRITPAYESYPGMYGVWSRGKVGSLVPFRPEKMEKSRKVRKTRKLRKLEISENPVSRTGRKKRYFESGTGGSPRRHRQEIMKAQWKEITLGDVHVHAVGLYASLNPAGHLIVNRVTHERMGSPAAVHLLYDAANNRIGLKPTSPAQRNAFRVGFHGNLRSRRIVSALKLMRNVGIELETIEFRNLQIDPDGILILDLRDTRVCERARKNRARFKKHAAAPINSNPVHIPATGL